MVIPNFSCSFSDLGDAARLALFEYEHYQNRFAAHKLSKYPPTFGAETLALLQDFMSMDDYQAHSKKIEAARSLYLAELKGAVNLFKTLKNYINGLSKDKTILANYYKAAGQQLFESLGATKMDDHDKLLNTMIRFIQANQADLKAKDLPDAFTQQLKDKQTSIKATNKAWLDEKDAATAASEAKTIVGNEIKTRVADIFLDAQTIFIEEKDTAKKFVWDTFLTKVRGARDAGFGGKITDMATKKGLANITVSIPALNLSVVTDADGRYEHAPLPEGVYDIDIKGDGFQPQTVEKRVVKAGVIGRLNIVLEAV